MENITEVKAALEAQKTTWIQSTTLWSDFSSDFETGMRQHKEAVGHDFLTENDVVDQIEASEANAELIDNARDLRSEALYDTIQSLDLN